ncbi:MAG: hypothetical protein D6677_03950 [Calditrichaeota bacterium]|nr:MAG: hypothetical protein D6677_03950 [Calditrichota bacterium]
MKNIIKIFIAVLFMFAAEFLYIQSRLNDCLWRVENRQRLISLTLEAQQHLLNTQSKYIQAVMQQHNTAPVMAPPLMASR